MPCTLRKVSCWPANEASGRSSAVADERTAKLAPGWPAVSSANDARTAASKSAGNGASITHWRICAPAAARALTSSVSSASSRALILSVRPPWCRNSRKAWAVVAKPPGTRTPDRASWLIISPRLAFLPPTTSTSVILRCSNGMTRAAPDGWMTWESSGMVRKSCGAAAVADPRGGASAIGCEAGGTHGNGGGAAEADRGPAARRAARQGGDSKDPAPIIPEHRSSGLARPTAMPNRSVFFVSDGTGIPAETFGNSILAQFPGKPRHVRRPFIDSVAKAGTVLDEINQVAVTEVYKPIVFITLVNDEVRQILASAQCRGLVLDMFRTFVEPLELEFGVKSNHRVGRFSDAAKSSEYHDRIEAINFSLAHDDGQSSRNLASADVILLGVSRSGKTPTSLYLAMQHGIKAANYPLIPEDSERHKIPGALTPYLGRAAWRGRGE